MAHLIDPRRRSEGYEVLFERSHGNPILTADDWPYPAHTVFNPGATRLADGTTLLLCRVEERTGHSHLCAARSANGIDEWRIDVEPTLRPDPERRPEEVWGIEDPRITYLPELGKYAVVYTANSRGGPCIALATTEDFRTFEKYGAVMHPDDKDAALLPRRIDGEFALVHNPRNDNGGHIWISYSPDLHSWGHHKVLLRAHQGSAWDANRIGVSPPPIETPEGWLLIYHGVRVTSGGALYRLGLALLDLEHPDRCLLRGNAWVFEPEAPYELRGDVPKVVLPCGSTIGDDGDTINLYYGAADTSIALAQGSIRRCIRWLCRHTARAGIDVDRLERAEAEGL